MPYPAANNPTHWRTCADEARRVADLLTDPEAREHMIACAEAYDRLAALSEKHVVKAGTF